MLSEGQWGGESHFPGYASLPIASDHESSEREGLAELLIRADGSGSVIVTVVYLFPSA